MENSPLELDVVDVVVPLIEIVAPASGSPVGVRKMPFTVCCADALIDMNMHIRIENT